jgi:signal transduction histidine kinase
MNRLASSVLEVLRRNTGRHGIMKATDSTEMDYQKILTRQCQTPSRSVRLSRLFAPTPPGATSDQQSAAAKPLRGGLLILARATWMVVAALTVSLFVAGVPAEFALLHDPCPTTRCTTGQLSPAGLRALEDLGLSRDSFAAYFVAMDVIFAAVCFTVAALIFWRRSDDRMGLLVSLALLTFGTGTFVFTLEALAVRSPAWELPIDFLHILGLASFGLFLYLFPDGRFVPRWTRWVALVWIAWQVPPYFSPDWHLNPDTWYLWTEAVVWSAALGTALYAQAYRYRRVSDAMQRRQIKWAVFGITSALSVFIGVNLGLSVFAPAPTSPRALVTFLIGYLFIYAAVLLIPVFISIAMLRHNLFDVDLVINRTLVYGALTAMVVGLYVIVVGGLSALLQLRGSLLISLIATGLVAVLFAPLRERLQRGVNRLMYGERDDPYRVLSRLGSRLESTLAPNAVLPTAARTVKEALRVPYAAIELAQDGVFETAASAGEPVDDPLRLPLVYGGETVGHLVLASRAGEEGFTPADQQLLDDLMPQIGVAAHAVRLTEEAVRLSTDLQRSRERLITTREEERRRLHQDLHDGLGPMLGSLTLKLDVASELLERDPPAARVLLSELKMQAQSAVVDVRRLVYALRPPALDDLGLLGAIGETAAQYRANGLHVSVDTPGRLPPLPAAVEVAAYRIAQEAMTNVARHAEASECVVRLALDETVETLRLEVRDDGRGLPPERGRGVGVASMRERAAELGGHCVVETLPAGGTRVHASLPCSSARAVDAQYPESEK